MFACACFTDSSKPNISIELTKTQKAAHYKDGHKKCQCTVATLNTIFKKCYRKLKLALSNLPSIQLPDLKQRQRFERSIISQGSVFSLFRN